MVAPSPRVRGLVLLRDGNRCVSCGARTSPLEMQHRQAVGHGGSKKRPDTFELATACSVCNARFESDLQSEALAFGWKVRRWVGHAGLVPMFNKPRATWGRLTVEGGVVLLKPSEAIRRMQEVYGPEWDRWAIDARIPLALKGNH